MGMKTGSALCQRTTDVISHIMASKQIEVYNYIDDIICVHKTTNTQDEFNVLHSLFEILGLPINPNKVVALSSSLNCMGIITDVEKQLVTIPQEKCLQILDACCHYITRKYITKKQRQLLGV